MQNYLFYKRSLVCKTMTISAIYRRFKLSDPLRVTSFPFGN
nr:MAG TPA: hypothetical protein [Caudoviricetes sp.]